MINAFHKKLLLAMLVLIFVSNLWVLISVWSNRSETRALVLLSERELKIPWHANSENSGVSLVLEYQVISQEEDNPYAYHQGSPLWLTTEKMFSLGFTEYQLDPSTQSTSDNKQVFIALELDGPAYQQSLAGFTERHQNTRYATNGTGENIDELFKREKYLASRLFAIDADTELETLQSRYAAAENVFVVPGVIATVNSYSDTKTDYKQGRIQSLSVPELHVPYPLNTRLKNLKFREYDDFQPSRYQVEVKFGTQFTPWVSDVIVHD